MKILTLEDANKLNLEQLNKLNGKILFFQNENTQLRKQLLIY